MIVGYIVLNKSTGFPMPTGRGWIGKLYSCKGAARSAITLSDRCSDEHTIYAVNMFDDPDTIAGEVTLVT